MHAAISLCVHAIACSCACTCLWAHASIFVYRILAYEHVGMLLSPYACIRVRLHVCGHMCSSVYARVLSYEHVCVLLSHRAFINLCRHGRVNVCGHGYARFHAYEHPCILLFFCVYVHVRTQASDCVRAYPRV